LNRAHRPSARVHEMHAAAPFPSHHTPDFRIKNCGCPASRVFEFAGRHTTGQCRPQQAFPPEHCSQVRYPTKSCPAGCEAWGATICKKWLEIRAWILSWIVQSHVSFASNAIHSAEVRPSPRSHYVPVMFRAQNGALDCSSHPETITGSQSINILFSKECRNEMLQLRSN
jgi:hypothetical protein